MGRGFTLNLFRHGITTANEKKQYLGWTDEPLNAKGWTQVEATAERIQGIETGTIISSDLIRCQETAKILFPHQQITTSADFREMHFGTFEMKTYASLKNYQAYLDWINNPFQAQAEGGESFDTFSQRVMQGMTHLQKHTQATPLTIVTHGGVVRLLLTTYVASERKYFEWEVPNASGYQLYWEDIKAFKGGEKCTSLLAVPSMAKVNG